MDIYISFCNSQTHLSVNSTKCCRKATRHRDKESLARRHLSRGAFYAKPFVFCVVGMALLAAAAVARLPRNRNQHEHSPDTAAGGSERCIAFSRSRSFARIDDSHFVYTGRNCARQLYRIENTRTSEFSRQSEPRCSGKLTLAGPP